MIIQVIDDAGLQFVFQNDGISRVEFIGIVNKIKKCIHDVVNLIYGEIFETPLPEEIRV
ncbi:hypothetical protein [Filifactor alocis]|uniref:hypothetical protein n=1 Tax=Filifactor alocis TaxID=143361 RepID=UPI003F9F3642